MPSEASYLTPEQERDLRAYAACDLSWRELQQRGFADYLAVLGGLGELGLRPPIAPMDGPNVEARRRGIALLTRLVERHRDV